MLKRLLAPSAAILSVVGLLAWLSFSDPGGPPAARPIAESRSGAAAQEQAGGSALPCAVPLAWRIAGIDDRFGLTPAAARAVVERAAESWARALGRPLFLHDGAAGFPIRFVYDERQERTEAQRLREEEHAGIDRRLEADAADLTQRRSDYQRLRDEYDRRLGDFERAAAAHGDTVRAWNDRGGAPAAVLPALRAAQERLDRERQQLLTEGRGLAELGRSFEADAERYNDSLEGQRRRAAELERAFPLQRIESGLYREAVRSGADRVASVQREISIYRFRDLDELQLVVAHELGHALGLGHVEAAGAVMSAAHHSRGGATRSEIRADDVDLFRERCPDLPVSAPLPP